MASDLFRQYNQIRQGMQSQFQQNFGNQMPISMQIPQIGPMNPKELLRNPKLLVQKYKELQGMIQNPEAFVGQMLQNGTMNQSTFSQLGELATQLQNITSNFFK